MCQIYFWVSDNSKDYVETKPLHESQRIIKGDMAESLHKNCPSLKGGQFFRIDCKKNYELIRELASFGEDLIVLSPTSIQNEVYNKISSMLNRYDNIRTKGS